MLDLRQLKFFVVSADMGPFSEASKVLYTTQSAISKSVAALERQLGFVFVFPDDNGQFDYDLRRYQLQFEALRTVSGMLYMSPEHMSGMQKSSRDSGKQMRDILPEPAKRQRSCMPCVIFRWDRTNSPESTCGRTGDRRRQTSDKEGFQEADF